MKKKWTHDKSIDTSCVFTNYFKKTLAFILFIDLLEKSKLKFKLLKKALPQFFQNHLCFGKQNKT